MNNFKKILLNVNYTFKNNNEYYQDSTIKDQAVLFDSNKSIDDNVKKIFEIKEIFEEENHVSLSCNGKAQSNIYIDIDSAPRVIGYIYKMEIEIEGKKVSGEAWVTMREIINMDLKELKK